MYYGNFSLTVPPSWGIRRDFHPTFVSVSLHFGAGPETAAANFGKALELLKPDTERILRDCK